MSEAVLSSRGAHGAEGAENVGQGVTPGDGGRAAGGCLDGDIENAVKGRLRIADAMRRPCDMGFTGIWLEIRVERLIISLHSFLCPFRSFVHATNTSRVVCLYFDCMTSLSIVFMALILHSRCLRHKAVGVTVQ